MNICATRTFCRVINGTARRLIEFAPVEMLPHEPVVVTEETREKAREWLAARPRLQCDIESYLQPAGTIITTQFGHLQCRHCGCLYATAGDGQ